MEDVSPLAYTPRMEPYRRSAVDYVEPPEPVRAPMKAIQKYAADASKRLRVLSTPRLADVVNTLRGRLHFVDLDLGECSGTIYVHGPRDFDIVLPEGSPPTRERFTIAHELGHYALHSRMGETPIVAPRKPPGEVGVRVEWEANWFAAAFLMPEKEFRDRYGSTQADLRAVAEYFRVSVDATRLRAKVLHLGA